MDGLTTAPYNLLIASYGEHGGFLKAPSGWIAKAVEGVWAKEGQSIVRRQPIVLMHGAIIRGRAIDKVTGQSLGGISIAHNGPHCPQSADHVMYANSDHAGYFSLRVIPGTTSFYIAGPS